MPRSLRYVALLRAINVGGRTVTMDRLRAVFASLGFTDVETVIASGNVLFATGPRSPASLERTIEAALADTLGYPVETFLRTRAELEAVLAVDALAQMAPAQDDAALSVTFLRTPPPSDAVAALLALRNEVDDFLVHGREVFWLRTTRRAPSRITGPQFERALRQPGTARNITTVRRLAARA